MWTGHKIKKNTNRSVYKVAAQLKIMFLNIVFVTQIVRSNLFLKFLLLKASQSLI